MTDAQTYSNGTLPLAGIRVLEFCHAIMGPSAGLILADLGADVIKVEPVAGDTTRRLVGFAAGFFGTFNRNKRSVAIDLKADAGRALLHRLAATADVVVENYAPGTMDRLGCGYEDLAKTNPRLIFGRRHHGRHVRRHRCAGGVARARAHRPRPIDQIGAIRNHRLPDGATYGWPGGDRPPAAADAGPRRRLGHLRSVRDRRWQTNLCRADQRSAMAPILRAFCPPRSSAKSRLQDQRGPRARASGAPPGGRRDRRPAHAGRACRTVRPYRYSIRAGRQAGRRTEAS